MTVARTEYLHWAIARYHDLACDLASSGTPAVPAAELGPPPSGIDSFAAWGVLQQLVAEREGWGADEVRAAAGATGAVTLACAVLLGPGDRVLVERPTYEPLVHIPKVFGAEVDRFDRRQEAGWALEPDAVARALRPGTKLVLVAEPNNPTGVLSPPEAMRATAEVVRRAGARLLVNEVYHRFHDARSARNADREILVADSVTKFEGLGWARGGWLAGPPEVVAAAGAAQVTLSVLAPASAAWAVLALQRPALADRARALASPDKRRKVAAWVAAHPRLSWVEPAGGLFGLVRVADPPDLLDLAERLRAGHGLLFAPGSFFDAPGTMRVSWSVDDACLDGGLELLAKALGA
ncbi:MAG: pyridoxal phosphate-dependent aminotransferase [Deltaproteobacteria bacterium]|nr:pyridoxal phosphate-dependent aminotransferase [Deltaproteobacteria bacterium]